LAVSLVFVVFCLRLNLRTAALFTPLIFAPMYVVSGFRLELTGSFIWMLGLLLVLPVAVRAGTGDTRQTGPETVAGVAGTALLGIAPLTALSLPDYLKGRHDVAERVWPENAYPHVLQFSCILGRHSCNLPAKRWTMMRLERLGGTVMATELGSGTGPRPIDES